MVRNTHRASSTGKCSTWSPTCAIILYDKCSIVFSPPPPRIVPIFSISGILDLLVCGDLNHIHLINNYNPSSSEGDNDLFWLPVLCNLYTESFIGIKVLVEIMQDNMLPGIRIIQNASAFLTHRPLLDRRTFLLISSTMPTPLTTIYAFALYPFPQA